MPGQMDPNMFAGALGIPGGSTGSLFMNRQGNLRTMDGYNRRLARLQAREQRRQNRPHRYRGQNKRVRPRDRQPDEAGYRPPPEGGWPQRGPGQGGGGASAPGPGAIPDPGLAGPMIGDRFKDVPVGPPVMPPMVPVPLPPASPPPPPMNPPAGPGDPNANGILPFPGGSNIPAIPMPGPVGPQGPGYTTSPEIQSIISQLLGSKGGG